MKMILTTLIILGAMLKAEASIKWLALNNVKTDTDWTRDNICQRDNGLIGRQLKFCRDNFIMMNVMYRSAADTKDECRDLLMDRRWNCRSIEKAPRFDDDLKKDTKETGLVYALSAAAIALNAAKECLSGKIEECRCQRARRHLSFPSEMVDTQNMANVDRVLGCKGITGSGVMFAEKFMDLGFRMDARNDVQRKSYAVRKHNVKVGLKELESGEEITCICNGATAGCVTKYCHRRLKQYSTVSANIADKYTKAAAAKLKKSPTSGSVVKKHAKYTVSDTQSNNLLFIEKGNDHCQTKELTRRTCVLDETKSNSCSKLCCGKDRYRERIIQVESKCRCNFVYCCRVECDVCRSVKTVYECV